MKTDKEDTEKMGTKNNPGEFDCYALALPNEPIFVLLGRDPDFARLVLSWANQRERMVMCGERDVHDMKMVNGARGDALYGAHWRKTNNGIWRIAKTPVERRGP
jgi:hypothetical protein